MNNIDLVKITVFPMNKNLKESSIFLHVCRSLYFPTKVEDSWILISAFDLC